MSVPATTMARPSWWAKPLLEMERRPRLVWGVHLVYFGLVIAFSVLVYELPDVQALLLSSVSDALNAPSGPLSSAAKAYNSGSIPRAAVTTFVINFFLGSLVMLTLPSMIVPEEWNLAGDSSLDRVGTAPGAYHHGAGSYDAAAFRYHAARRGRLYPGDAFRSPDPDSYRSVEPGGNSAHPLGPRALAQRAGELLGSRRTGGSGMLRSHRGHFDEPVN